MQKAMKTTCFSFIAFKEPLQRNDSAKKSLKLGTINVVTAEMKPIR